MGSFRGNIYGSFRGSVYGSFTSRVEGKGFRIERVAPAPGGDTHYYIHIYCIRITTYTILHTHYSLLRLGHTHTGC